MGLTDSQSLQDSSILNICSSKDSNFMGIMVTTSTMEPETCNGPKCLEMLCQNEQVGYVKADAPVQGKKAYTLGWLQWRRRAWQGTTRQMPLVRYNKEDMPVK